MAVRKRGSTWQIDYTDPSGKRVRKSFKKKKDADLEHGKRISLIGENRYLDVKKECKTTVEELIRQYTATHQCQKSFDGWKSRYLDNFSEYFKPETILSQIGYAELCEYRTNLKQRITVKGTLPAVASVNRELVVIHHMFSEAIAWEVIDRNPFSKFNRSNPLLGKENNARIRYLSEDEIPRLLGACPEYLRDIVICALNTGMRKGEILGLKWDQIRNGFIYVRKTKTDRSRQIPVNDSLSELFTRIKKQQQVGQEHVFTYTGRGRQREGSPLVLVNQIQGNSLNNVKHSFMSACRRAGVEDFRFHDLRHTFASHFIMKNGSLKELQEILGHTTINMTMRYAHLSQDNLRTSINRLNGLFTVKDDQSGQIVTNCDVHSL